MPLLIDEPRSHYVAALLERDEQIVVWWSTRVECSSALARRRRDGTISSTTEDSAMRTLEALQHSWYEIPPSDELRLQARRVVRTHALRTGDALQLAAAIVWSSQTETGEFVCFDTLLREAARLEGLAVV